MYAERYIVAVVFVTFGCSFANGNYLNPKQEQDVVNFIKYEIDHCEVHDEISLNKCLEKVTELLTPYMRYGIKAWNVPVLEPLFLKSVKVNVNHGGTRLRAHFKDILVHGLSSFDLKYIRTNPENYSFELGVLIPDLRLLGHYDIDGKLLILTLKDHGPFTANLTQVDVTVTNQFEVKNGLLIMQEANTDFTFKTCKFRFDNLLNGSDIGDTINDSLNKDVDMILKDLKPTFIKEINKIIVQTLKEGLQNLPLPKWQAALHELYNW